MSDSLRPHGLYSPWNSLGQNPGVGSLSLLQGIFPTKGLNPGPLHCLEKEMATHPSILAWRIPWTEEPGGLQSVGSQELDTTEWLSLHFTSLRKLLSFNLSLEKLILFQVFDLYSPQILIIMIFELLSLNHLGFTYFSVPCTLYFFFPFSLTISAICSFHIYLYNQELLADFFLMHVLSLLRILLLIGIFKIF